MNDKVNGKRLDADWATGRAIGERRHADVRDTGRSSQRLKTGDDAAWENIIGAVGELALSRRWNLPMPEFRTGERDRDEGWDLVTSIGRIDVKSVASKPWYLAAKDSALAKQPGADFYALVWCPVDDPSCVLVGFVTRGEIEAAPHVAHVLDPTNKGGWERDIPAIPGRWLPVEAGIVHDAQVLLDAVDRGVPASLWVCTACRVSLFSALRQPCAICGKRMFEANTYASVAREPVLR